MFNDNIFIAGEDDLVRIHLPLSKYDGLLGILKRWVHDQWYVVEIGGLGVELMLDADRGEFERAGGDE